MKKDIALPLLALLGGGAGFVLRRVQWATGFEAENGLPIPGAPAALLLVFLTLVIAAALLFLYRGTHRDFQGYDDAFFAHSASVRALNLIAAALLIAAGAWRMQVLLLTDWPQASMAAATARILGKNSTASLLSSLLLPILCTLFCLASAIALLLISRNNYWQENRGKRFGALLIPAFGSCLWLILTYRDCSDDPVLTAYAYHLLAIICITLALYQTATFSFSTEKHPAVTLFFSLMSVYFSLVALADGHGLIPSLLLLAAVLFFTAQSFALLHNDAGLPWAPIPTRLSRDRADRDEED